MYLISTLHPHNGSICLIIASHAHCVTTANYFCLISTTIIACLPVYRRLSRLSMILLAWLQACVPTSAERKQPSWRKRCGSGLSLVPIHRFFSFTPSTHFSVCYTAGINRCICRTFCCPGIVGLGIIEPRRARPFALFCRKGAFKVLVFCVLICMTLSNARLFPQSIV